MPQSEHMPQAILALDATPTTAQGAAMTDRIIDSTDGPTVAHRAGVIHTDMPDRQAEGEDLFGMLDRLSAPFGPPPPVWYRNVRTTHTMVSAVVGTTCVQVAIHHDDQPDAGDVWVMHCPSDGVDRYVP